MKIDISQIKAVKVDYDGIILTMIDGRVLSFPPADKIIMDCVAYLQEHGASLVVDMPRWDPSN